MFTNPPGHTHLHAVVSWLPHFGFARCRHLGLTAQKCKYLSHYSMEHLNWSKLYILCCVYLTTIFKNYKKTMMVPVSMCVHQFCFWEEGTVHPPGLWRVLPWREQPSDPPMARQESRQRVIAHHWGERGMTRVGQAKRKHLPSGAVHGVIWHLSQKKEMSSEKERCAEISEQWSCLQSKLSVSGSYNSTL